MSVIGVLVNRYFFKILSRLFSLLFFGGQRKVTKETRPATQFSSLQRFPWRDQKLAGILEKQSVRFQ
jgi:hypothetical protein